MTNSEGMTIREIILEVRTDVKHLDQRLDDFENLVVLKTELQLWKETQNNTRRWAITTIVSVLSIVVLIATALATGLMT